MKNVHTKGFTLIELLMGLIIVAVLATLALPSFRDTLRKSRRADAMNTILDVHLLQGRHRVNNTTYGTLVQLGKTNPLVSSDAHYSITVTVNTATNYTIFADAQGDQVNDSCGDFTLTFTAGAIAKTADGDDSLCWNK